MKNKYQISIILILLILVTTLLSISIWNLKDEEVKNTNCTAILINLKGLDYPDLQYTTFLAISEFKGTFDIFPLTAELKGDCSVRAKKVYYSYKEFPIEDVCFDGDNCLWRFKS